MQEALHALQGDLVRLNEDSHTILLQIHDIESIVENFQDGMIMLHFQIQGDAYGDRETSP